jgi:hypothetical protein
VTKALFSLPARASSTVSQLTHTPTENAPSKNRAAETAANVFKKGKVETHTAYPSRQATSVPFAEKRRRMRPIGSDKRQIPDAKMAARPPIAAFPKPWASRKSGMMAMERP